jgi:hypothetical protein
MDKKRFKRIIVREGIILLGVIGISFIGFNFSQANSFLEGLFIVLFWCYPIYLVVRLVIWLKVIKYLKSLNWSKEDVKKLIIFVIMLLIACFVLNNFFLAKVKIIPKYYW